MEDTLPVAAGAVPLMYVRALYDYEADDQTSLSFRAGETIQVLTQLESGWWDGVIGGQRGWFPSNYCALIPPIDAERAAAVDRSAPPPRRLTAADQVDILDDLSEEDEYDDPPLHQHPTQNGFSATSNLPQSSSSRTTNDSPASRRPTSQQQQHADAAFWIPQATPDGRLFYFNTLTGVSTMELPLESPSNPYESGPSPTNHIHIPQHSRAPAEMHTTPTERDPETDNDQSGSETGDLLRSRSTQSKRRSGMSDGASPATSMDSLVLGSQGPNDAAFKARQNRLSYNASSARSTARDSRTSSVYSAHIPENAGIIAGRSFDDGAPASLTWNRLIEDMRKSVALYRQAVEAGEKAQLVPRAEDISDHLRLILAAGSGSTDHYSGAPAAIVANKDLYPRFRDMMSHFSKLVLSSHIAAASWSPSDQQAKCFQEAEGVLNGVYGFVDVARLQRGDELARLFPGFMPGVTVGGNWQNHGFVAPVNASMPPLAASSSHNSQPEPNMQLDASLLDRMRDLKAAIATGIKQLDSHLTLHQNTMSALQHQELGDAICDSCQTVVDSYRPWMSTLESVNLAVQSLSPHHPQLVEFAGRKQRVYSCLAEIIHVCQVVTIPLADEWAEKRGDTLDVRLIAVHKAARELELATAAVEQFLEQVHRSLPEFSGQSPVNGTTSIRSTMTSVISKDSSRPSTSDNYIRKSMSAASDRSAEVYKNGETAKVRDLFGEVPIASSARTDSDETPEYLRLDHEGEIQYDMKTSPPTIKGGTLVGLVEQLTRHDRVNTSFNNTFLLTYQSFITAPELFEMIIRRWNIQPPPNLTPEQYHDWQEHKQKIIRVRIVNVMKSWFEWYWMEGSTSNGETGSQALLHRIQTFVANSVAPSETSGAGALLTLVEQRLRGQDNSAKRMVQTRQGQIPSPILPKNMKKLKFLDIDPLEFARQLTIIESRLYSKIKPYECLNKIWQRKLSPTEPEPAANVKALILHSNQLTNWVAQMILSQSDVKKRVIVIKNFVTVADKCQQMSNFSTLTSIISALGTAPIHRLSRTWAQVNSKTMATLEKMRGLMGATKNFAEYREALHAAKPPCVPFFGVYLTDLTFIEDGIPGTLKRSELLNFGKRAKVAEVIRDIQSYQNTIYPYKSVPELQDYILSMMQSAGDVHEMYERSLAVEPREREDEKIARLLSESGFM